MVLACSSPPSDRDQRVEGLFRAHAPTILACALRKGVQFVDAEDIVSETFLVCLRRRSAVPEEALPWLVGVAHKVLAHQFRTESRKRALRRRLLEVSGSNLGEDPDPRLSVAVLEAFSRLGASEKELLWHTLVDGMTYREVGIALGMSAKAVDGRLVRARAKLRAAVVHASDEPQLTGNRGNYGGAGHM